MFNHHKSTYFFVVVFASLLFSSCKTTRINFNQEIPPAVNIDRNKDTVVLDRFTGNNAADVYQVVQNQLGTKMIQYIDRKAYDREVRLTRAQAQSKYILLSGDVIQNAYNESVNASLPQTCELKGVQGKGFNITKTGTANVAVNLSFSNLKTGATLYSNSVTGTASKSQSWATCNNVALSFETNIDINQVVSNALTDFGNNFDKLVDYYNISVALTLYKGETEFVPSLNAGHSLFAAGDLNGAIATYRQAIKEAEANPSTPKEQRGHAYFALGIALGFKGNQEALATLDKAFSINPEPGYVETRKTMMQYYDYNRKRFKK